MAVKFGDLNLYSLEDIAGTIGISTVTLRSYIAKGKLKAKKFGGRFYISEDALREYFTSTDDEDTIETNTQVSAKDRTKAVNKRKRQLATA